MIKNNIEEIKRTIARACESVGRATEEVEIVCVTKTVDVPEAKKALSSGIRIIGENRVQEAMRKYEVIGEAATWHLIGHLQSNKVKYAVRIFSLIHSVDSVSLAKKISDEAQKLGKIQDILCRLSGP